MGLPIVEGNKSGLLLYKGNHSKTIRACMNITVDFVESTLKKGDGTR
jgi:hypothetical protein